MRKQSSCCQRDLRCLALRWRSCPPWATPFSLRPLGRLFVLGAGKGAGQPRCSSCPSQENYKQESVKAMQKPEASALRYEISL